MKQFMARILFPNGNEETVVLKVENKATKGLITVEYTSKPFNFRCNIPMFFEWIKKMGAKEIERVEI